MINTQCHPEKLCCLWLDWCTCVLRGFSSSPSPLWWWPAQGFRIQTPVSVLKQRKGNLPSRPLGSDVDSSTEGTVLEWKKKCGLGSEAFRHSLAPHLLPQLCHLPSFVPLGLLIRNGQGSQRVHRALCTPTGQCKSSREGSYQHSSIHVWRGLSGERNHDEPTGNPVY